MSCNWNRIDYIYKRKVAIEMHKIVKGTEGHRLSDMFETKVSKRRGLQLQVKRLNTKSERNTLNYRGTIVWNSLTTDVKNACSKEVFKRLLTKERSRIEQITFEKGKVKIKNKDLETFIYF